MQMDRKVVDREASIYNLSYLRETEGEGERGE